MDHVAGLKINTECARKKRHFGKMPVPKKKRAAACVRRLEVLRVGDRVARARAAACQCVMRAHAVSVVREKPSKNRGMSGSLLPG